MKAKHLLHTTLMSAIFLGSFSLLTYKKTPSSPSSATSTSVTSFQEGKLQLSKQNVQMLTIGEKMTLQCTVYPLNATDKRVRWKSSDPTKIAIVASSNTEATIERKATFAGEVAITVETVDPTNVIAASCLVRCYNKLVALERAEIVDASSPILFTNNAMAVGYGYDFEFAFASEVNGNYTMEETSKNKIIEQVTTVFAPNSISSYEFDRLTFLFRIEYQTSYFMEQEQREFSFSLYDQTFTFSLCKYISVSGVDILA